MQRTSSAPYLLLAVLFVAFATGCGGPQAPTDYLHMTRPDEFNKLLLKTLEEMLQDAA